MDDNMPHTVACVNPMSQTATVSALLDDLLALTDEQIAAMPDADQRWVTDSIERELTLRSPAAFATKLSDGQWEPYEHLIHTSDAIVSMIDDDDCDILVIEEPVRHGKTLTCSRWTPAWFICKYRKRVMLASYEADFAATHGRAAREIVKEHGGQFGIEIDETSRAANRWQLVGSDIGMGTAGANGPITGKGGDLMIVDDPIKNSEEAQSPVMREKLWEWWQSTFLTRREPGAKVLIIMSRWHEDDLIGRLVKNPPVGGARIKRIRLPAIAEEDDPMGRRPGDALCPERYDTEALAGIRIDVGPGPWASLYQQRPVPLGGGMFKKEWFPSFTRFENNDRSYYRLGDRVVDAEEVWKFATMDVAYTRTKRSDYTAIATWGVCPGETTSLALLDMRRVRVEHAEHAPLVKSVWDTHRPAWVGIEKQSATLSMFDEVQRQGVVVRWLTPDKNKVARAETAAALAAAGRIWVPENADWLSEFLEEVLTFPVAKHDDMVDCLSYAAGELARRAVQARHHKQEPTTAAEIMWERLKKREKATKYHQTLGRF
jgi:predicted phage terminase large subunit-like protein